MVTSVCIGFTENIWFKTDSASSETDSPHGNRMDPSRLAEMLSLYRIVKIQSASPVTTGHWDPREQVLSQLANDPTGVRGKFVEHDAKRNH